MDKNGTLPKYYLYIPLLIAAFLYLFGIMRTDLWTPDEPRYAEVAREMVESGNYIQPHLNGKPYTEKPPLFFWTVVAGAKVFGGVNQLAVRLPSILSALGILALLIAFVSENFDRKKAFLAAIILCVSPEFFWLARSGHIDMLLTFLITASLTSFYKWYDRGRYGYLILFYLCLSLATFAKGPVGMLLPVMVVVSFLSFRKEWGRIKKMHFYIGLPMALIVVLAWYIPAMRQSSGYEMEHIVQRQIIGRIFHPTSHGVSMLYWPFYQFKSLSFGMAPWSFLLPWGVVYAYRSRRREAPLFFLFCWAGVIFAFFTLIASKREVYILPMYPAGAALIALWIYRPVQSFNLKPVRVMLASFGVILMSAFVVAAINLKQSHPGKPLYSLDVGSVAIFVGAGAFAVAVAIFGRKLKYIVVATIGVSLIALTVIIVSVLPLINEYKSPLKICNIYNHNKDTNSEIAMLRGTRAEYVFYTKSIIKPVESEEELKEFFNSSRKMFCFVRERDYKRGLANPDFPLYVKARMRVSSRIMMLLCNQDISPKK
ncbi:MAG: ArnT family glycosyltransferase [Candidatus Scalindua sp.]